MKIIAKHVEILIAIASLVVAVASWRVAKTKELIVQYQFDA